MPVPDILKKKIRKEAEEVPILETKSQTPSNLKSAEEKLKKAQEALEALKEPPEIEAPVGIEEEPKAYVVPRAVSIEEMFNVINAKLDVLIEDLNK